jgi:outer membrane protein assembly factor BamB
MRTPLGGPRSRRLLLVVPAAIALALGTAACGGGSPSRGAVRATGTAPPPLTVLTRSASEANGDIFIAPAGGSYPAGPEILTTTGKVVWFHRLPAGEIASDFRAQAYLGQPVLTWFQSTPPPAPTRLPEGPGAQRRPGAQVSPDGPSGTDYIYNDRYQQIATVRAGNGAANTFHEFLITPRGTALIAADTTTTADLASIGGPADQRVIDGLVQEVDIRTGRVLFQWDSTAHVPYADSYVARPSSPSTPWDWFHINAVHLDTDGNLLVSSRNTWTVFKVDRHTGQVMWQLGSSTATGRSSPGSTTRRLSAATSTRSSTTSRAATCSAPAAW